LENEQGENGWGEAGRKIGVQGAGILARAGKSDGVSFGTGAKLRFALSRIWGQKTRFRAPISWFISSQRPKSTLNNLFPMTSRIAFFLLYELPPPSGGGLRSKDIPGL